MTLGEWIEIVNEKAGIHSYQEKDPYFLNIPQNSKYFADTQAAVEWGILDTDVAYDPTMMLNRDWAAGTLINLSGQDLKSTLTIQDLQDAQFAKQIETAVAAELMELDDHDRFHPKKEIKKNEAEDCLVKVVDFINNRNIEENVTDIQWQNDFNAKMVDPIGYETDGAHITIPNDAADGYQIGDMVSYTDVNTGLTSLRKVTQCNYTQDGVILSLEEVDLLSATDAIDLAGTADINFDNAEIIYGDQTQEVPAVNAGMNMNHHQRLGMTSKQKTFQIGAFECRLTQNGTTLSAELFQTLAHGTKVYALAKTSGVKTAYRFKTEKASIEDAYFKIQCNTEENFGVTNGSYKNLYGDFSKVDPQSFLQTVSGLFQEKKDVLEETITVCTIRVPIPSAPLVSLKMAVELHLQVSGKAEIVFTQKNVIGTEYKNGNIRFIKDCSTSHQNKIKASMQASTGMRFALECALIEIMDAGVNAGAKASAKTEIHLYLENGDHTQSESSISADVADELAQGNPDVLVCADLSAYLILNLKVNSNKTMLGKLGLSGNYEVLGEKNASIFGNGSQHFENWHQVKKCTRLDRMQNMKKESLQVKDQIGISSYSLLIEKGTAKTIEITALPKGYSLNDLQFQSKNTNIAMVSTSGIVKAVNAGSTIITISSKDGMYSIQCHVLVPSD